MSQIKIQGVKAPSQLGTGAWIHPAGPKGEAISPPGHRCCHIYIWNPFPRGTTPLVPGNPSLSRLLQEAELFKLHTQSSQHHFHSAQLIHLWLCLFFLNTDFYKLNKLSGTVIARQPRPGNSMPEHSQALQAPADTGKVQFSHFRTSSSCCPAPSASKHSLALRAFNLAYPNTPQELEGTHQDHWVWLQHRTPQQTHPVPQSFVQMLLEFRQTWCCDQALGSLFPVLSHL